MFGLEPGLDPADLQVCSKAQDFGDTGFSPEESTMLKNILSLRERSVDDVMVPRTDIVAVQQDVPLGDMLKVFKDAAHSRLVSIMTRSMIRVGMVHIRDSSPS